MITEAMITEAIRLIEQYHFYEAKDSHDLSERIADAGLAKRINATSGVTKCCLLIKGKPYVIKWSPKEMIHDDETAREIRIYKRACKAHLEKAFPETRSLGIWNGREFSIQQKISFSSEQVRYNRNQREFRSKLYKITRTVNCRVADAFAEEAASWCCMEDDIDGVWRCAVISIYGKKFAKKLSEFLHQNHVNDLHDGNTGYIHKQPVVLDFSGYRKNSQAVSPSWW